MDFDRKKGRLKELTERVRDLEESPLYEYRRENGYLPVIGEGSVDAEAMLIGEAPGKQEAKTGRPFVGAAGRVLDGLLESVGLDREEVYITNVVKDRPPGNRDPHVEEIELYAPFLLTQMEIIQPEVIATLGRFAMDFILEQFGHPNQGERIGDLHGQMLAARASYGEVKIVPLYHPAAVFYNRDLEHTLERDFQVLRQFA